MNAETGKVPPTGAGEDAFGRNRIVSNVLWSWGAHLVLVAAGFVLPRMIDRSLGQGLLGVWDLCWSLVSYFTLLQGGIVSAVNRYVARHRAVNDIAGLNIAVSSVTCLLTVLGLVSAGLSVAAAYWLPVFLGARLGPDIDDAQWCVLLLGLSFSLELGTAGIAGVITGCHRWDLHNLIHVGTYGLRVIAMVVALALGWGLPALAAINLAAELLGRCVRITAAYRVCPGLRPRPGLVRWHTAREMIGFGGKTFAMEASDILLNQSVAVLIAWVLGPAALAIFARPRALVHHVGVFAAKMAYVVSPTASALQSAGNHQEIRDLLIRVTRYAAYFVLPPVAVLAILGDSVLHLWMGPNYAAGAVLGILSIGLAGAMVHDPLRRILAGMNLHGVLALTRGVAVTLAIGGVWIALQRPDVSLVMVSLLLVVPCAICDGMVAPFLACRRVGLSAAAFWHQAWLSPLLCVAPLIVILLAIRLWAPPDPLARLGLAALAGLLVVAPLYWMRAIPHSAPILARLRPGTATANV